MVTSSADQYTCIFSSDRKYRYVWSYQWGEPLLGRCLFIMCNPSKANETRTDNTVARCIGFTAGWGFDELIVCNIFAYISTDPRMLKASHIEPIGMENDHYIVEAADRSDLIICGWSNQGLYGKRGDAVKNLLLDLGHKLHYLQMNASGQPKHPLYIAAQTKPKLWVA